MHDTTYTFTVTLDGQFDEVEGRVREALSTEGFGVLSEIDIAAAMKDKLGEDLPPYKILGACNPPLAWQALQVDPRIGALLPCNVVVREVGAGRIEVAFAEPDAMLALARGEGMAEIGAEARERLQRVADAL